MFHKEHFIVDTRIKVHNDNANNYLRDAEEITDSNAYKASAVFQEIGMQALFAAVTLGVANYLSETKLMISAGKWLTELGPEGSITRTVVMGIGEVGGASTGKIGEEALAGVLAREFAGIGMLLIRNRTGDFRTKQPQPIERIRWQLFLTVLIASVGSPGPKGAGLLGKFPTAWSRQGAAQGVLLFNAGLQAGRKAWLKPPESGPLLDLINPHHAGL